MSVAIKNTRKHTIQNSKFRKKRDSYRKVMRSKPSYVPNKKVVESKRHATTTLCEIVARYEDIDIDNAMFTLNKIAAK